MNYKKILFLDEEGVVKITSIILTALLSAGIAFLTNLLSHLIAPNLPTTNIETAGIIGGFIRAIKSNC